MELATDTMRVHLFDRSDHSREKRVRTAGRPGEVYNIGSGVEVSNRHLTALLLELCGADWDSVEMVTDRPGHDRRYSVDTVKIRTELGWAPRRDFLTALADTVDWYRKHDEWLH